MSVSRSPSPVLQINPNQINSNNRNSRFNQQQQQKQQKQYQQQLPPQQPQAQININQLRKLPPLPPNKSKPQSQLAPARQSSNNDLMLEDLNSDNSQEGISRNVAKSKVMPQLPQQPRIRTARQQPTKANPNKRDTIVSYPSDKVKILPKQHSGGADDESDDNENENWF
jgi:hypothetical protein